MRETDPSDFYAFTAMIGDSITPVLKPGEDVDGVDMDLYLYDAACNPLGDGQLGKGIDPKGTPDFVLLEGAPYTGTYYAEARRVNGIGNYVLDLRVTRTIPTLPGNDASTGADAPDVCAGGVAVSAPTVFEGQLLDGDTGDAYTFTVPASKSVIVTVQMELGTIANTALYGAGCGATFGSAGIVPGVFQQGPFSSATTLTLHVSPHTSGGNYVVTIATR